MNVNQDSSLEDPDPDRRKFVTSVSTLAMLGGLGVGYGTFFATAARYLYPDGPSERGWMFVTDLASVHAGDALEYVSPDGQKIAIARLAESGAADDFVALSSVCPHLGCQVHWESQNDRFFCPCHNGAFDRQGTATEGPPADAGQSLSRYPLRIEDEILFIEVPLTSLDRSG